MLSSEDLAKLNTVGTHSIVVTYNGYTTIFSIEIMEDSEENIVEIIQNAINNTSIPTNATANFTLPLIKNGVNISWKSNSTNIVVSGANALVNRPSSSSNDVYVTLTATFSYEGETQTKNYTVLVKKQEVQNNDGSGYDGDYYDGVSLNLVGTALKAELRELVQSTHKKYTSYADCKTYLPNIDEDPNNPNNMILFYTGESVVKSQDLQNDWNREHVWAQSLAKGWFTTSGAGSDLHHIRPCNIQVNSARGNQKFGESSSYYEPSDEYKGDVARIIFYLMIAYSESDSFSFTSIAESQAILLEWNELDPVSNLEILRNDKVEDIQGNRNPFIDYPYLANSIWG